MSSLDQHGDVPSLTFIGDSGLARRGGPADSSRSSVLTASPRLQSTLIRIDETQLLSALMLHNELMETSGQKFDQKPFGNSTVVMFLPFTVKCCDPQ